MRWRLRWLAFAAAVICVLGTLVAIQLYEDRHPNSGHHRATKEAKDIAPPEKPDDRLARYTLWLAIFTGALVVVSAIQIRFLIRADETARRSADAAKAAAEAANAQAKISEQHAGFFQRSADAAVTQAEAMRGTRDIMQQQADAAIIAANAAQMTAQNVERPYIFVKTITGDFVFRERNALLRLIAEVPIDLTEDKNPNTFEVKCVFRNYGRTPAIIDHIWFDVSIFEYETGTGKVIRIPPDKPVYREENAPGNEYMILGQFADSESYTHALTHDDIKGMHSLFSNKWPMVFGYVRYRDVAGHRYQCGFGFNYAGRSFTHYGREYNYDRELPDDPA